MRTRNVMSIIVGWILVFFSASAGAWSIGSDFDSQAIGSACTPFWDGNYDSTISSDRGSSGSQSCRMKVTNGGSTWGGGMDLTGDLQTGDEIWIRLRTYAPAGFSTYVAPSRGGKLKFIRITERSSSGTPARLDWYWPNRVILERDDVWQYPNSGYDMTTGVWETWEMYVMFDKNSVDNGGTGRVRLWKNGTLIGDLTARGTLWSDATRVVDVRIFDHWNGGAPQTQHLYLDDLVVTNDPPSTTDSAGNRYIGMGSFVAAVRPLPPSSILTQ